MAADPPASSATRHFTPGRPEDVLAHVPPYADIIIPLSNGEPPVLLDTLEAHADRLTGVRVHQMHALADRAYIRGELGDHLRHVSYFLSNATRQAYWNGTCDLVPNNFSEMPHLLRHATKCSLVIARATPPDRHGYFSLGTNADYTTPFIGHVPFFLEADPAMPRTFGENAVHMSEVVGWCEGGGPLAEIEAPEPSEADERIAALVAEYVEDGATIQAGIGAIPNELLKNLTDRRNLGVHTEMLSDGIMDLVEAGAVNGTNKRLRRNKTVTTFALGSAALYRWMNDNPSLEMLPVDWVNDPRVIAREPNFVSINATTEVDLFGQCASETVAGRYWSSSGGQADFARGAMYSPGGKAFVVLRSTTRDGRSRIRCKLTEGSVVTTLKNTVDHVVTEWGVAELRGRSLAQRAEALIAIAHPDHRDELAAAAGLMGRGDPATAD